jgi:arylformamidase
MEYYDISQSIHPGIMVWPGDQPFECSQKMRISRGDPYNLSAISMSLHTGTHLDAPFHFIERGADISVMPISQYIGPARVVDLGGKPFVSASDLRQANLRCGERLLLRTRVPGSPEMEFSSGYAWLTRDAAEYAAGLGAPLVGIDTPSVDAFDSPDAQAHKILLSKGIAVLEGIRLDEVPPGDFELICLPLKLAGLDGSPVRAILRR